MRWKDAGDFIAFRNTIFGASQTCLLFLPPCVPSQMQYNLTSAHDGKVFIYYYTYLVWKTKKTKSMFIPIDNRQLLVWHLQQCKWERNTAVEFKHLPLWCLYNSTSSKYTYINMHIFVYKFVNYRCIYQICVLLSHKNPQEMYNLSKNIQWCIKENSDDIIYIFLIYSVIGDVNDEYHE